MKLFGKNHLILCAVTFIILFMMNYLGNDQADKLERALMMSALLKGKLTSLNFYLKKHIMNSTIRLSWGKLLNNQSTIRIKELTMITS